MGSYGDAFGEHEQSCEVIDNRPDLYSDVYGEKWVDHMGDIQDDESPFMIQYE